MQFPKISDDLIGKWVKIHKNSGTQSFSEKVGQIYQITDVKRLKDNWRGDPRHSLLLAGTVQRYIEFSDNETYKYLELVKRPILDDIYPDCNNSALIGGKIEAMVDDVGGIFAGQIFTVKCTRKNEIYLKEKKKWWRVGDNKIKKWFKTSEYANIFQDITDKLDKLEKHHESS